LQDVPGWTYGLDFDHPQSTSKYHHAQPLPLVLLALIEVKELYRRTDDNILLPAP
jgi:hypothetical protein